MSGHDCILSPQFSYRLSFSVESYSKSQGAGTMQILVVEDDKKIASFVVKGLTRAGFAVDQANDGERGLELAVFKPYDVIILDLMLPKRDGLSVVGELRRRKLSSPIIILSAKHLVEDRIKGLDVGGDDYLIKPFSFSELLARVHALIRRSNHETEPSTLIKGDLQLDLLKRTVTRSGKKIELQQQELKLLAYLMCNYERVVSKTLILENIWGYSFNPQTNVVDVLISRLRSKLDRDFEPKLIHTVRGFGYVLKAS
jgi:two-component system OmpR family response regulator